MSERGVYRSIYSALIDDPDFNRLSANAKLVLLVARQCREAGPAAIYTCYPDTLARQTTLPVKEVEAALVELERGRWLEREQSVLWIRNGLRYEPNMSLANLNHRQAIRKQLTSLPKLSIVGRFCHYYEFEIPSGWDGGGDAGSQNQNQIQNQNQRKDSSAAGAAGAGSDSASRRGKADTTTLKASFEQFWKCYPRKVAKDSALRAWVKRAPDPALVSKIMAAVEAQKKPGASLNPDKGPTYIPYPATWLHGGRWEDEVVSTTTTPGPGGINATWARLREENAAKAAQGGTA